MITLNSIATTAISTATGTASQEFAGLVNEKLCRKVCVNQSIQPSANVTYTIDSVTTIDTTTFVRIKATGVLTYVPKGCNGCQTLTQSFTEYTTIIFSNTAATAAPTISLNQGTSRGYLANICCMAASNYEVATDVTVTATY